MHVSDDGQFKNYNVEELKIGTLFGKERLWFWRVHITALVSLCEYVPEQPWFWREQITVLEQNIFGVGSTSHPW